MSICAAGTHIARAIGKAEVGKNSNDRAFIRVRLKPVDQASVTWDGYFTDATIDRTREDLMKLGWDGESSLEDLDGLGTTEVEIVVEHESYTGRDGAAVVSAKVKWINKLGGAVKTKANKDELRELNALLGVSKKSKRPAPAPARGYADADVNFDPDDPRFGGAPSDDDLPF